MGEKAGSFADRVLHKACVLLEENETVASKEISLAMKMAEGRQHKRVVDALCDIVTSGRLVRVKNGVYRKPDEQQVTPEIREVMWRVLRMRRAVTIEDLQEMAGAAAEYAREWLRMLAAKGIVRKEDSRPGLWRLIVDPVQMPSDQKNAEKLRRIRERKKKAMADLYKARNLIEDAINGMAQNEAEDRE